MLCEVCTSFADRPGFRFHPILRAIRRARAPPFNCRANLMGRIGTHHYGVMCALWLAVVAAVFASGVLRAMHFVGAAAWRSGLVAREETSTRSVAGYNIAVALGSRGRLTDDRALRL